MANQTDATILYRYLVEGWAQQDIADEVGLTQSEVSKILRKEYGINKGNQKWGRGKFNQAGKYPNLTWDEICDYIDSGSMDLDAWLGGYDGGDADYDDGYEEEEYCEEEYCEEDSYANDGGYQAPQSHGGSGRSVTYVNPDDYADDGAPVYGRGGRRVTYVNPDDYDDDGNYRGSGGMSRGATGLLVILGILILGAGWGITKLAESENLFGLYLKLLWDLNYLWYGLIPGIIYGFFNYLGTHSFGAVLTNHALYTWTGLGYVLAGIVFFIKYIELMPFIPALILVVLGLVIGFVGYKLFNRE